MSKRSRKCRDRHDVSKKSKKKKKATPVPWWNLFLSKSGKALPGFTCASYVAIHHGIPESMGVFGLIVLIQRILHPDSLWPWFQGHLRGWRKTRSLWRKYHPRSRAISEKRTFSMKRMTIGGILRMPLDIGSSREKLRPMSDLPEIVSLRLRFGQVPLGLPKSEFASRLEEISCAGDSLSAEVREALLDDSVMTLGNLYGDPLSGNPIVPEYLKITFADGSTKDIEVYNLGILMIVDNREETRRLFRIFTRIKESGKIT